MTAKEYDNKFSWITEGITESVDLCLILFSFLYSCENAFTKAADVYSLDKYRKFFDCLAKHNLYINTKYETDEKYKTLITDFIENKPIKETHPSHFYRDLENTVNIHNKDSKKSLRGIFITAGFMILFLIFWLLGIVRTIKFGYETSKVMVFQETAIFVLLVVFCVLLIKFGFKLYRVYDKKEKDPETRFKYRDLSIDFCFEVLHQEMKQVYSDINARILDEKNLQQVQNLLEVIKEGVKDLGNNEEILKAVDGIKEKIVLPIQDLSIKLDNIQAIETGSEVDKYLIDEGWVKKEDEFLILQGSVPKFWEKVKKSPLKNTPKEYFYNILYKEKNVKFDEEYFFKKYSEVKNSN